MNPMDRKELEALVEKVYDEWVRGERDVLEYPAETAVTDALWEKMVPTRRTQVRGGSTFFANCPSAEATGLRALICTDTPAEPEPRTLAEILSEDEAAGLSVLGEAAAGVIAKWLALHELQYCVPVPEVTDE